MEAHDNHQQREEIYSIVVRAGKRTYFFDVKETRSKEKYLTITESKRRFSNDSGKFFYEKHKLFLYQEDFDKFFDGLTGVMDYIRANPDEPREEHKTSSGVSETEREFTQSGNDFAMGDESSEENKDPDMPEEKDDEEKEEDKF